MITVKSKEELEKAIKAGHKEILVSGKKLQAACYLASKFQSLSSEKEIFTKNIMSNVGTAAAVSEATVIFITITICITAISIIAIIKGCNVKIDYLNGKITVKNNK